MIIKTINKMASSQASLPKGGRRLFFSSLAPGAAGPLRYDISGVFRRCLPLFYRGNYASSYTCWPWLLHCTPTPRDTFIIGRNNSCGRPGGGASQRGFTSTATDVRALFLKSLFISQQARFIFRYYT